MEEIMRKIQEIQELLEDVGYAAKEYEYLRAKSAMEAVSYAIGELRVALYDELG